MTQALGALVYVGIHAFGIAILLALVVLVGSLAYVFATNRDGHRDAILTELALPLASFFLRVLALPLAALALCHRLFPQSTTRGEAVCGVLLLGLLALWAGLRARRWLKEPERNRGDWAVAGMAVLCVALAGVSKPDGMAPSAEWTIPAVSTANVCVTNTTLPYRNVYLESLPAYNITMPRDASNLTVYTHDGLGWRYAGGRWVRR